MSVEDLEIDNINRIERLLVDKHGELSSGLVGNIDRIRQILVVYEIDETLLNRTSEVMYEATMVNDIKAVEDSVKYLLDTFWHQIEE